MKSEVLKYQVNGLNMESVLYFDETKTGKRPAILVFPEAFGLSEHTKEKAQRLAELGYVTLANDLFGESKTVSTMDEVEQIFAPGGAIEAFEAAKKAGQCRFIGFTGHHDPAVHQAMLKHYSGYDSILMPLNPADPNYLSFEKDVLPIAVERGMGIQGMKSTANSKLLHTIPVRDCISYALSLPIHCLALGCTTLGQIEDDVRIAQQFAPLTAEKMASLRTTAAKFAGPQMEDWKRNTQTASAPMYRDGVLA